MARGVDGRIVYTDDRDRHNFLRALGRLKREAPFSLLAYCLMGNHFHLAIQVRETALSSLMHRLLTSYVMTFNKRHERTGHLFQARYKAIPCRNDSYLLALVRYIHMNPVRAGLTTDPALWPWSSHAQYRLPVRPSLTDTALVFSALHGGDAYDTWMSRAENEFDPWPQEAAQSNPALFNETEECPPLETLAQDSFCPTDLALMRSAARNRRAVALKRAFSKLAVGRGHSKTAIARWLGCSLPGVHHLLAREANNLTT